MKRTSVSRSAFTLVEIMIVVAIVGLLVALAVPGFVKARKHSEGIQILNVARLMDGAIQDWGKTHPLVPTGMIDVASALLCSTNICSISKVDLLGNPYVFNGSASMSSIVVTQITTQTVVRSAIQINAETKSQLAGLGIDWGPY